MADKKPDFIALALYQMAITKHLEVKKISKELEKHLDNNYVLEESWVAEDFITDAIYGEEYDTETFIKQLNNISIWKL